MVSFNKSFFEWPIVLLVLSLLLVATELSGRSVSVVVSMGFVGPVVSVMRVLMFHAN